jgi:copper chaperone CopZ
MKTATYETPVIYGDHHVLEVRRLLSQIPGVIDSYVSSAFQTIEVMYDESKTNDIEIAKSLDAAGYLGEWTIPIEIGARQQGEEGEPPFFRHTQTYEATRHTVSFGQRISYSGRPLWPCPGMGPVQKVDET